MAHSSSWGPSPMDARGRVASRVTPPTYRPLREDELPQAADLFLASVADMYARHGIAQAPPPREVVLASFGHVARTGTFHVAEVDGRIDGIASAVVRDAIWFLSTFWVRPGSQRRGLGGPLLDGVLEQGRRAGGTIFCTYSSIDTTAMASYMRRGMLPGWPILTLSGALQPIPDAPAGYDVAPLNVETAAHLDRDVRGTGREADHRWWQGNAAFRGHSVRHRNEVVGSFYVVRGGSIGPACWTDTDHAQALMTLAFREAAAVAPEARVYVPGVNHDAIRVALAAGLRLTNFSHFLTTSPFGRMERYLASGPSLF